MATEGTDGGGGTANVRDKYATDDEHPQAGARRRTPSSSHIRLAAPVLAHPDSGRVCPSRSHLTYSSRNVDGHITSHAVPIATRPAIPAVSPPTRPDTPPLAGSWWPRSTRPSRAASRGALPASGRGAATRASWGRRQWRAGAMRASITGPRKRRARVSAGGGRLSHQSPASHNHTALAARRPAPPYPARHRAPRPCPWLAFASVVPRFSSCSGVPRSWPAGASGIHLSDAVSPIIHRTARDNPHGAPPSSLDSVQTSTARTRSPRPSCPPILPVQAAPAGYTRSEPPL